MSWTSSMKNLFTVKSSDCNILLSRLQTSKAYSRIGRHLCFRSCSMTYSEASLPTLANIRLANWLHERLEHLNIIARTINTQWLKQTVPLLSFVHKFDKCNVGRFSKFLHFCIISKKFETKSMSYFPSNLKYVTALSCKMQKTEIGEILLHLTQ